MTAFENFRKALEPRGWQDVERLDYKPEGSAPFRDISRELLFRSDGLRCELRYFEVAADGHSSLERHEHEHAVMILHGRGDCLVGKQVRSVSKHDLIHIPAMHWHQFRAAEDEALGFLCMVNVERDRPQLPNQSELDDLKSDPLLAAFIRY